MCGQIRQPLEKYLELAGPTGLDSITDVTQPVEGRTETSRKENFPSCSDVDHKTADANKAAPTRYRR